MILSEQVRQWASTRRSASFASAQVLSGQICLVQWKACTSSSADIVLAMVGAAGVASGQRERRKRGRARGR
eukprot:scaffold83052_cov37-Tisochrysis_lutea.AAC.2